MPWNEVSIMDQRLEFVVLASCEGANVAELCRRFGISRQTGYKWLGRFSGREEDLADRSRRPAHQPFRTAWEVEEAALAVRDEHPAWGARKIARCLETDGLEPPAVSTVHAILRRHGRIDAHGRIGPGYTRFEQPAANLMWQMDFKGRVRMGSGAWCHPLTVIDDHSRYALCLQACENERGETVKPLLERTFRVHGLPGAFYLDNGSPWGGSLRGRWTPLTVWLLKLGIEVIHSRPYHPQGRGKIERFHRSLKAEVFEHHPFANLAQVQKRFDRWRMIYNTQRPHEALHMDVPASRYRPSPRALPDKPPKVRYDNHETVRRVGTTKAYLSFRNRLWKVPQAFRSEDVAIRPCKRDGLYGVFYGATRIATIDLNA